MKADKQKTICKQPNNRRRFLVNTGGAVTSFLVLPRYVLGAAEVASPSDRLNIAIIGTGGRGTQNMKELMREKDVQITAICDVTEEADYSRFYYGGIAGRGPAKAIVDVRYSSDEATKDYKECGVYIDFRKMFDAEKDIDAVVVATPDHNHPITALEAIRRGKHVYCEKPLARTVYETRVITEAARKAGVATQLGNQGHSGEGIRQTVEWIQAGVIGEVKEIHSWHNGVNPKAFNSSRPSDTPPVPEGLDWDLWLGAAEKRPYHSAYTPYMWRDWRDFGTGPMGDFGCHNMDPAFWALDLKYPVSLEAFAVGGNKEAYPAAGIVYYNFPARGTLKPITLTWYGGVMPQTPEELGPDGKLVGDGNGILFIGDQGKIMCPGWAGPPTLIPKSRMKDFEEPPKTLKRSKGHHRDWVDACKGGEPASSNFDYSGVLSEVVMLGNVAMFAREKFQWDAENMKAINCPKVDELIRPVYHNGWEI